ncbi:MAG: hypothetical protein WBM35_14285 [Candidatus Electrothrix sp.]
MKISKRWSHRPLIQEKDFIATFGMTPEEIMKMMTLPLRQPPCAIPTEDFIDSFGMLPDELSRKTGIPMRNIEQLIAEKADEMKCSPCCMLKLAKLLGAADAFLVNLTVKGSVS